MQTLRSQLDNFIVGQSAAKDALCLGLLAGENVLLKGEPGCGKTLLAEITAQLSGLKWHLVAMHRDTSGGDLLGLSSIRQTTERNKRIISIEKSNCIFDNTELLILDDLSRAPGETVNILLSNLNQRPSETLRTAIATLPPDDECYQAEALDPATCDRFLLQVFMGNILGKDDRLAAEAVLNHEQVIPRPAQTPISKSDLSAIAFPKQVQQAYLRVLRSLINDYGCSHENSLLTDRTMLVKMPHLLLVSAVYNQRTAVSYADLWVLKLVLAFRIPQEVYDLLDLIITQAINPVQLSQMPSQDGVGNEEGYDESGIGMGEAVQGEASTSQMVATDDSLTPRGASQKLSGEQAAEHAPDKPTQLADSEQDVQDVEILLQAISGRLAQQRIHEEDHPGGLPRGYKPMQHFEQIEDADATEVCIWLDNINPQLPRTLWRRKKNRAGRIVIIRDISQSMEGRYANWTASIIISLMKVFQAKRLRVGYIEFNHFSTKMTHKGRFFTRRYESIIKDAQNVFCSGVTNYQNPLQDALDELEEHRGKNDHILVLTDGEPTQGDWTVKKERQRAKDLGVCMHTLFIGVCQCPEILDIISDESSGEKFIAVPLYGNVLTIKRR